MLELPTVTLCCVDTRAPALALWAMARCLAGVRFADAVLFTDLGRADAARDSPLGTELGGGLGGGLGGVRLEAADVPGGAAYSAFVLKELAARVRTPHVLVVQWDGFVLRPDAWDPAFLAYDYVGPRWPHLPADRSVGNGGFSLRSRALLAALQDPRLAPTHPEDVAVCQTHRGWLERDYGVRFAPPAVADRFGFERAPPRGPTFGFHGVYNFPGVLGAAELRALAPAVPDDVLRGADGRDLCKALIRAGQLGIARDTVRRRAAAGGDRREQRRLALALALAWARRPLGRRAAGTTPGGVSSPA